MLEPERHKDMTNKHNDSNNAQKRAILKEKRVSQFQKRPIVRQGCSKRLQSFSNPRWCMIQEK